MILTVYIQFGSLSNTESEVILRNVSSSVTLCRFHMCCFDLRRKHSCQRNASPLKREKIEVGNNILHKIGTLCSITHIMKYSRAAALEKPQRHKRRRSCRVQRAELAEQSCISPGVASVSQRDGRKSWMGLVRTPKTQEHTPRLCSDMLTERSPGSTQLLQPFINLK